MTESIRKLELAITDYCNLQCALCSQGTPFHKNKSVMSLEDLERMSSLVIPFEFEVIKISGGEPTMHPHFGEICRMLRRWFPANRYEMSTNGFKLESYLHCTDVFDAIFLSLYPGKNDAIVQRCRRMGIPNLQGGVKKDYERMVDVYAENNIGKENVYAHCEFRDYRKVVQDRIYPCCIIFGQSIRQAIDLDEISVRFDEHWRDNLRHINIEPYCKRCFVEVETGSPKQQSDCVLRGLGQAEPARRAVSSSEIRGGDFAGGQRLAVSRGAGLVGTSKSLAQDQSASITGTEPAARRGSGSSDEPYLSVVVTSRNDDHGGNTLHRTQVFASGFIEQCKRFGLDAELIFVEWNPPSDRPRLYEALRWPEDFGAVAVRFIEVPPEIHHSIGNSDKFPLFQMIAKNVGIRRALGKFVLATNIDILFSNELMEFLARRQLKENCFYRIDRHDVGVGRIPENVDIDAQLDFCGRHLIRIHTMYGTKNIAEIGADHLSYGPGDRKLHTHACGDFTLMSRRHWHALRAHPELPLWSIYVDGVFLHMAQAGGLHQEVLDEPMRIYHIEHEMGYEVIAETMKQRPSLDYTRDYRAWCQRMIDRGRPVTTNDEGWGYASQDFQEHILGGRSEGKSDSAHDTERTIGGFTAAGSGRPFTIFSIPKPFSGHIGVIQRNAIKSWTMLCPRPEIILFGDEEGTREAAEELGISYVPEVKRNECGTPLVDDLFSRAEQIAAHDVLAYVNADIIITSDFGPALERVRDRFDSFLMIGRRHDVDIAEPIDFNDQKWEERLRLRVGEKGTLHGVRGIDYFAFTKGLWPDIPPFSLGRTAWDNWLVYEAFLNHDVVDSTECVCVAHQNHAYNHVSGGRSGVWKGDEARQNQRLAGETVLAGMGSTDDATWRLTGDGVVRKHPEDYPRRIDEYCRRLIRRGWRDKTAIHKDAFESVDYLNIVESPTASVIIIGWRLQRDAITNLRTLNAQRCANFEVIFVDNGASPGEFLNLRPYIDTYVRLSRNTGAYLARNAGAAFANGRVLIFVDDDGIVEEGFVASYLRLFEAYDIIAARGAIRPKGRTAVQGEHDEYGDKAFPYFSCKEGNCAYDAQAFFAVGGWDDAIIRGGGGLDLCCRLLKIEPDMRKQIYSPRPVLYHDSVQEGAEFAEKKRLLQASIDRLRRKHFDYDVFQECYRRYRHRDDLLITRGCGGANGEHLYQNQQLYKHVVSVRDAAMRRREALTADTCSVPSRGASAEPTKLSIIVTVYQKEHQIGRIIEGIIDNTTSPFELVMVYDGCTDRSEDIVNNVLAGKRGCMRKLTVVHTPDVNETRANNAGMKAADGDFFILVQDDMLVLEKGWQKRLLEPMLRWGDVFAVSARNAHNYRLGLPPDTSVQASCTEEAVRDIFKIRFAVNRGPLALHAHAMLRLNYLDEAYSPLYFDDIDLCVRAYRDLQKVCGVYGIRWKNLQTTVGSNKNQPLSTGGIWRDSCRKNLQIFWQRYHKYLQGQDHDEDRPLVMEPERQTAMNGVGHGSAIQHNQRGAELFNKGDIRGALEAFEQAVTTEPNSVAVRNNLAKVRWKTGNRLGALESLKGALGVDPDDRQTVYNIVRCYRSLNLVNEAAELIRMYLSKWGGDTRLEEELSSLHGGGGLSGGKAVGQAASLVEPVRVGSKLNMQVLGTDYGGWAVDLSLIPRGSTVIAAGVGEDISFDLRLIELRGCTVVGVDPTEKARDYVRRLGPCGYHFLQKALHSQGGRRIRIYRNSNPEHVSESILPTHRSVAARDYYEAETVSLMELMEAYPNVSLVKMDIEGAEYEVLNSLENLTAAQLCVEFHHHCTHYSVADTMECVRRLERMGYVCAHSRSRAQAYQEVTFVRAQLIGEGAVTDHSGARTEIACVGQG